MSQALNQDRISMLEDLYLVTVLRADTESVINRLLELLAECGGTDEAEEVQASPETATDAPESIPLPKSERMQQSIAILRLAKGWEDKLLSAGVLTVQDLGSWIASGKLVAGCFPRVGPEAVQKIKQAWRGFVYPDGVTESQPDSQSEETPTAEPAIPAGMSLPEIFAEGADFARLGKKVSENPHRSHSEEWHAWDRGWQEYYATHETPDDPAETTEATNSSAEPAANLFPADTLDLAGTKPPKPELAAAGVDLSDL